MSEGVLLAECLPPGCTITLIFGKPIVTQMSDETPDTVPNSEEIFEEEEEIPTEEDIIDEDDGEEEEEIESEDEGVVDET